MRNSRIAAAAALTIATAVLTACTATSQPGPTGTPVPSATASASSPASLGTEVTVVTHDSFAVPDAVLADFEAQTGLTVTFVAPGDSGTLVNQLILTKDAPLGDVAYGVDNSFASRALAEDIFADYTSAAPAATDAALWSITGSTALTAIDYSDVCLNYDLTYFAANDLPAPTTLSDLTAPEYAGLVSVTNPATSSPGLAFLMATVAEFGDDWETYWAELAANDLRVTAAWSDTYFVDFSVPNYGGDYPIVLSYASSPPSEVIDGTPTSAALLDSCFRQVEYAGVLEGAQNPAGAQAVIDWMLSDAFQAALPEYMYVYPVSSKVEVPADWSAYAPLADEPLTLDPQDITANRDAWIERWTQIVVP
jgi:thiamine transport system substrate-binding protein